MHGHRHAEVCPLRAKSAVEEHKESTFFATLCCTISSSIGLAYHLCQHFVRMAEASQDSLMLCSLFQPWCSPFGCCSYRASQ